MKMGVVGVFEEEEDVLGFPIALLEVGLFLNGEQIVQPVQSDLLFLQPTRGTH